MSTNSRGEVSPFDYEELANLLLEQGEAASPAQLHGCLCGLLAAGASHEGEAGLAGLNHVLDLDLHGELAEQVISLYVVTAIALQDEEFDFYPLLPDDDTDLPDRTAALAGWSQGFLSGYTGALAVAEGSATHLPGDSPEILKDLAAIADADLDEIDEDEDSERSYAELAEYVRFAALNAFADRVMGDAEPAA